MQIVVVGTELSADVGAILVTLCRRVIKARRTNWRIIAVLYDWLHRRWDASVCGSPCTGSCAVHHAPVVCIAAVVLPIDIAGGHITPHTQSDGASRCADNIESVVHTLVALNNDLRTVRVNLVAVGVGKVCPPYLSITNLSCLCSHSRRNLCCAGCVNGGRCQRHIHGSVNGIVWRHAQLDSQRSATDGGDGILAYVQILLVGACLVDNENLAALTCNYIADMCPSTRNDSLLNPRAALQIADGVAFVEHYQVAWCGLSSDDIHTVHENLAVGLDQRNLTLDSRLHGGIVGRFVCITFDSHIFTFLLVQQYPVGR